MSFTATTSRPRALSIALAALLLVSCAQPPGYTRHVEPDRLGAHAVDLMKEPGTTFQVTMRDHVVWADADDVLRSIVAVGNGGSSFVFDHPPATLAAVRVGATVVLPRLALRKVTRVERSGDALLLRTQPAVLTDVIRDGVIRWNHRVAFGSRTVEWDPDPVGALLRAGSQPALADDNAPVTLHHRGDVQGWHYDTTTTVATDHLNIDERVSRQGPGGMQLQLHATGVLENFETSTDIEIHDGTITKFDYANKDVHGTIDFAWTASKSEKDVGTVPVPERVLTLPPLAEIPLDIGGLPFTLDVDSAMFVDPGFSGAGQQTRGHFTVKFSGDQGFTVSNGATTPDGTVHGDVTIEPDSNSSSVLSPFGFIAALALPRLELKSSFVPLSLDADNGKLGERARKLLEENGWRAQLEMPNPPGLKPDGSYVELVLSGGEAQSGPHSLLPCEQTNLYVSFKAGGAGTLGVPVQDESKSFQLKELHRYDPPGKGCAPQSVAKDSEEPAPVGSMAPCDLNATGSASDFFGVPHGSEMRGFLTQKSPSHGGEDVGRLPGTQVFANLKDNIPLAALQSAKTKQTGLPIQGTGDAHLIDAKVVIQPWSSRGSDSYGAIVGLAAHYGYKDNAGAEKTFTTYLEYEHLITDKWPPRADEEGHYINSEGQLLKPGETYQGCMGFGALMKNGATLTATQLDQHPLIGFLGATISPHVHIEAWFKPDTQGGYFKAERGGTMFDPGVPLAH